MFVAVRPVKQKSIKIKDKVLIFDTEDLSLEYVSLDLIKENLDTKYKTLFLCGKLFDGYVVAGSYKYISGDLHMAMLQMATNSIKRGEDNFISSGKVAYSTGMRWLFGDYEIDLSKNMHVDSWRGITRLLWNEEYIHNLSDSDYQVQYAFLFREYLVVRLLSDMRGAVLTIVYNKLGEAVCIYTTAYFIGGDKSLMTRIELTVEY